MTDAREPDTADQNDPALEETTVSEDEDTLAEPGTGPGAPQDENERSQAEPGSGPGAPQ